LYYYLELSAEEAFQKTSELIAATKKVNGYFQFLAHNDLLSENISSSWFHWRKMFEEMLTRATSLSS
ncbi:MAG: hypothetical protein ACHQD9_03425, partial [Chitinophagales bacterium]